MWRQEELVVANQRIEQLEIHSNELDATIDRLKDTLVMKDNEIRGLREEHRLKEQAT